MKSVIAISLLSVFATSTLAQSYPSCADTCLENPTDLGSCGVSEVSCLCNNSAFVTAQTFCFQDSCTSASDLQQAYDAAQAYCEAVGVTLTTTATQSSTASGTSSGSADSATTTSASTSASSPSATSDNAASTIRFPAGAVAAVVALFGAAML